MFCFYLIFWRLPFSHISFKSVTGLITFQQKLTLHHLGYLWLCVSLNSIFKIILIPELLLFYVLLIYLSFSNFKFTLRIFWPLTPFFLKLTLYNRDYLCFHTSLNYIFNIILLQLILLQCVLFAYLYFFQLLLYSTDSSTFNPKQSLLLIYFL